MNREIKFRVWTSKTMDYFPETHTESLNANFQPGGHGTGEEPIFMQYTGLKDKNGKEIYEGDIVISQNKVYEVVYLAPTFVLRKGPQDDVDVETFSTPLSYEEIIGNRYQNPELLN